MATEMKSLVKSTKLVRFLALDGILNWIGKQYNLNKNKALKQGDKNWLECLKVMSLLKFFQLFITNKIHFF